MVLVRAIARINARCRQRLPRRPHATRRAATNQTEPYVVAAAYLKNTQARNAHARYTTAVVVARYCYPRQRARCQLSTSAARNHAQPARCVVIARKQFSMR